MPPAPLPVTEADRLQALHSYSILDTSCEQVFDDLTRLAARLTRTPMALISLVDTHRQWFKSRHGLDTIETPRDLAFCAHAILDTGRALVVPDATRDMRFRDNALVTASPFIRFYAGVPLVTPEGHAVGTLCVLDQTPREIAAEELENLRTVARAVETTLELRRALRVTRDLALTDALTGLPNRPALLDCLRRAIAHQRRSGASFALIYLDLDGFKAVNDRHGHAEGDRVLRIVSAVLRRCVRVGDVAARIGGDEFAILILDCNRIDVSAVSSRIKSAIARAMRDAGLSVTASAGATLFKVPPKDELAALNLVDRLMYDAKSARSHQVLRPRTEPEAALTP